MGNPATEAVQFTRCQPYKPGYNVTVWIDGRRENPTLLHGGIATPTDVGEMISRIGPENIEMMEIFRGGGQIPAEYAWDGCAVVAIWTRYNPVNDTTKAPSRP